MNCLISESVLKTIVFGTLKLTVSFETTFMGQKAAETSKTLQSIIQFLLLQLGYSRVIIVWEKFGIVLEHFENS
jgi:hypothetical protein